MVLCFGNRQQTTISGVKMQICIFTPTASERLLTARRVADDGAGLDAEQCRGKAVGGYLNGRSILLENAAAPAIALRFST